MAADPFDLIATDGTGTGSGDFKPCPAGSHPCMLVGLIDLGTHTEEVQDQKTKEWSKKDFHKLLMVFDVSVISDEGTVISTHPMILEFNRSTGPTAKLRGFVEEWQSKKFKVGEPIPLGGLLGQWGMANVISKESAKGKVYSYITSVSPVPGMNRKAVSALPRVHDNIVWTFSMGEYPDPKWIPYNFGEPVANIINRSHEKAGKGAHVKSRRNGASEAPVSGRQPGVSYDQTPPADKPDGGIPF